MKLKTVLLLAVTALVAVVVAFAEPLGTLEKSVVSQMIARKGYKGVEIIESEKTPYSEDGVAGWSIAVQFVDSQNKTYWARLWVNKRWSEGRVIEVSRPQ